MSEHTLSGNQISANSPENQSMIKVLLWATLFQIAWHLQKIPLILQEGRLGDGDDFLRLNQIRNWMSGQDWYDVTVHRMATPIGGDLHWSRVVDVLIALMIKFFDFFLDTQTAERVTAIVWPILLMLVTTYILVKICDRLVPQASRLLTLFFIVTCIGAMVEFAPGRIDHHGAQICLLALSLLGVANAEKNWGGFLTGASIAFSVMIGLDTILLVILILAWFGFEWALNRDNSNINLRNTAFGLMATSLLFYPIFVAPSSAFEPICDANSVVYLSGLWAIGISFLLLVFIGPKIQKPIMRILVGAVIAIIAAGILYAVFPQCVAGPLSGISEPLWNEWLSNVLEAQGMFTAAKLQPHIYFSAIGYLLFLIVIGGLFLLTGKVHDYRFIGFYALLVLSAFAAFLQLRAMRVGIITSIPICVWISKLIWDLLIERFNERQTLARILNVIAIVFLSATIWLVIGNIYQAIASSSSNQVEAPNRPTTLEIGNVEKYGWHEDGIISFCDKESNFVELNNLSKSKVMNELNTGPAILIFTDHQIIAANYHRNEKPILDSQRFYKGTAEIAKEIAKRNGVELVTYCQRVPSAPRQIKDPNAMANRMIRNELPNWLEKISSKENRLMIFKVKH